MNDTQSLTIAMSMAPTMLIVLILIGILINNARLGDLNARFGDLNASLGETYARIGELRSELHRVEEVIDARLKHIEGR